jgi:hypothetical protein
MGIYQQGPAVPAAMALMTQSRYLLPLGCHWRRRDSLRTVALGLGTARSPIGRGKGDAPELWSGLGKFHPDFRDARFADGTEIHHAARELFFRHYVPDRQQFSHGDGCAQQYQGAVRIDDHGFGLLGRQRLLDSVEGDHNLYAHVDSLTPAKVTHPPQLWIDGVHGDTSRRRAPLIYVSARARITLEEEAAGFASLPPSAIFYLAVTWAR